VAKKYKVVVVGMGKRGMHHATTFQANPRFEVAGICDIDQKRLDDAAAKLGVAVKGKDAAEVTNGSERARKPARVSTGQKVIREACDSFFATR